ncbi:heme-degrading domain-containing protein [Motilibacter deserti]|uniref:heme-degrading domain-containing protein n=1 Tax=Motilibacter deserti TaxID=2714956 RepID=UPI002F2B4CD5
MPTTGNFTPEQLLDHERELVLPSLSNDDAIDLGLTVLRLARERSLPVLVEVRRWPQTLFRAALPGTAPDNDAWVDGKARVVQRFGHSSLHERVRHEAAGTTFADKTGLPADRYAAHGGGFPLAVQGTGVVGVLLVSGLPQVEDHALAVEALREFLAARRG